jgi:hypothetical protein
MSGFERDYLKKMLFEIQKYMLNLTKEEINKIDITSLASIEKTDKSGKLLKAINSGEYFKVPFVRSEQLDRHGAVVNGGIKGITQTMKNTVNEIYDHIDPREYTKDDLKVAKEAQLGLYEMYDVYARQNDETKLNAIKESGIEYFELNLDTIAHRVAFSKIRKYHLDHKLPIIVSYI